MPVGQYSTATIAERRLQTNLSVTTCTAAFGMIFVLGSYIYSSVGEAKSIAASRRIQTHSEILESRKRLGMDAWDQKAERERLRSAGSTSGQSHDV
jgi:hypothetical protein